MTKKASLSEILIYGSSIAAGSLKGFSDGVGINLHALDYLLPVIGTIGPLAISAAVEPLDKGQRGPVAEFFLGGFSTGISYALGRTVGYFVNHYK